MDNQKVGLSGEFFVAAELLKRGIQVALTLGNAKDVDLLVQPEGGKPISVQVKTLKGRNCFDLSKSKVFDDFIYVFVFLNKVGEAPEFFILKGSEINADPVHFYGASINVQRETINYGPLAEHKDKWEKFY